MKKYILNLVLLILGGLTSCEGFLDEKPDKAILVPDSVEEYEAIIDNYDRINSTPPLPFIYADDYWTSDANWLRFLPWQQNAYSWSTDPYLPGDIPQDYFTMYRKIFSSNVVLDKLSQNPAWSIAEVERLKGKALFWRAHGYFELAVLYLPIPASPNADANAKIPLLVSSDFGVSKDWRPSTEIMEFILSDMQESMKYLPETTAYPTQPSLYSAYGLLARIHLYLGNFDQAISYAEMVMEGGFELLDYGGLDMDSPYPVQIFNSETILFTFMLSQSTVSSNNAAFVDSLLVKSYDSLDYRSNFLFLNSSGSYSFKGNYTGRADIFTGIALDEIFLILAEANARLDRLDVANEYLNHLLAKRMKNFEKIESQNKSEVLDAISLNRRKSLLFRGQRWADLKRMTLLESDYRTLRRTVEGELKSFQLNPENLQVQVPLSELILD